MSMRKRYRNQAVNLWRRDSGDTSIPSQRIKLGLDVRALGDPMPGQANRDRVLSVFSLRQRTATSRFIVAYEEVKSVFISCHNGSTCTQQYAS
jgi:hypothetical protein